MEDEVNKKRIQKLIKKNGSEDRTIFAFDNLITKIEGEKRLTVTQKAEAKWTLLKLKEEAFYFTGIKAVDLETNKRIQAGIITLFTKLGLME